MGITHTFVSEIADGEDATLVRPSNWNAAHSLGAGDVLPIKVRKTADETVNNSSTLQNDDHLLLAVGANEVWHIFMLLIVTTEATPDFQYAFTVPSGGSIKGFNAGHIGALASALVALADNDLTVAQQINGAITTDFVAVWGLYVGGANAGNLQLQWAQATANASNTTVFTNSFILAFKLT